MPTPWLGVRLALTVRDVLDSDTLHVQDAQRMNYSERMWIRTMFVLWCRKEEEGKERLRTTAERTGSFL